HRWRGRTFARIAAQGEARDRVRGRDLASPNGSRDAFGAALPGCNDLVGTPLSPRLRSDSDGSRSGQMRRVRTFHCDVEAACGRLAIVTLAILIAGACLVAAAAQTAPQPVQSAAASPEAIKQREQELEAARAEQNRAAEQQARLRAEIAAIGQDR